MDLAIISLIFRIPTIFLAILMGYLAYQLFVLTKGATKGWMYLSIGGFSLFMWAASIVLFSVIFPHETLRYLTGAFFLFMMAIFQPLAYTKLAESFHARLPRWWNVPTLLALIGLVVFTLMAYGSMGSFGLQNFLTVAHFTLAICMLFALLPSYRLMKETKKSPWIFSFLFCLVVALGMNVGQYYNNCCNETSEFSENEVCAYDLDYLGIYEAPCNAGVLSVARFYQLFLLVGIILGDVAFFKLWRGLKAFK
ncbi:MAG: hypothetical protein R6V53_02005 [Candidatus Woesearchaeota archaeon]